MSEKIINSWSFEVFIQLHRCPRRLPQQASRNYNLIRFIIRLTVGESTTSLHIHSICAHHTFVTRIPKGDIAVECLWFQKLLRGCTKTMPSTSHCFSSSTSSLYWRALIEHVCLSLSLYFSSFSSASNRDTYHSFRLIIGTMMRIETIDEHPSKAEENPSNRQALSQ